MPDHAACTAVSHIPPAAATSSRRLQEKEKRAITDVGDGVLEGAAAVGSSFLRGFRGLVEKPLQGAQKGGLEGGWAGVL